MVKVNVKWGKETYPDVEADLTQPPLVFKTQLFTLTCVPPERQKVMIKGALLKDDDWGKAVPKEGLSVMLMGSAEAVPVDAPKAVPVFVEDLPEDEQDTLETKAYGSGLQNLGNTCYMNSTLQCLYKVAPLRETLSSFTLPAGSGADPSGRLVVATRQLFKDLEKGGPAFPPFEFLISLRSKFPQFGQQTPAGVPMQQDAEECWTNLLYTLREKVKTPDGKSIVDEVFGVGMRLKLKSAESGEEVVEDSTAYVLKCNIDNNTNHLHTGIELGLKDDREKMSEALGRSVVFKGSSSLTRLPPYLPVQLMRFFYKADTQQKAKILRKVTFPIELDVYEFCSPELKAQLDAPRAVHKEIQDKLAQEKKIKAAAAAKGAAASAAPAAVAAAPPTAAAASSTAPVAPAAAAPVATAQAASGSGDAEMAEASTSATSSSSSQPYNMTGKYELVGVLTHKGRSADSGHYVAWTKQPDGTWILFDDDKLIFKKEEEILELCGGGDWHMGYLLLYKAVTLEPSAAAEAAAKATANAAAAPAAPVVAEEPAPMDTAAEGKS